MWKRQAFILEKRNEQLLKKASLVKYVKLTTDQISVAVTTDGLKQVLRGQIYQSGMTLSNQEVA